MSFKTVETVLEHSQSRGSARMVLVVIAECANHEHGEAWPAIKTIAHRAGISRASVFRQIKRLVDLGELEMDSKAGGHGCNRYRVTLVPGGSQDATVSDRDSRSGETEPSHSGIEKVSPVRPEPEEPPREPTDPPKAPSDESDEIGQDFAGWLSHHWATTQMNPPRAGTKALADIEAFYRARRAEGIEDEGYSAVDLELAVEGAYADPYRREHGYFDHESVLRPTKIHKLVEAGRRLRAASTGSLDHWKAWVAEHLPELAGAEADQAAVTAQLQSNLADGVTPERVRARMARRQGHGESEAA